MGHRTRRATQCLLLLAAACGMHVACAAEPGLGLDARRTFSIPAQPMASALLAFSTQADIQVMTASRQLQDRMARAVSGEQMVREALNGLLGGTGLRFHVISETAVSIELDDDNAVDQGKTGDGTSGAQPPAVFDSVRAASLLSAQPSLPQ